jgi:plasmid stabilization system protein ParE
VTFTFDPLAKREYEDALEYYEAQEEGLGEKFRTAVWEAIAILERFPAIGDEVRPEIRKILLRRFPYKLIYAVLDGGVYVIAVAHGHREPDYWLGRAK